MEMIEKTGKTVEEALEAALAELGVDRDQVEYRVVEAPSKALFGLLGGREAKVEVTLKKVDPTLAAREFLDKVTRAMGLKVTIDAAVSEEGVNIDLRGEDLGLLIGKHGQTLDALQYLTNLASQREGCERIRS